MHLETKSLIDILVSYEKWSSQRISEEKSTLFPSNYINLSRNSCFMKGNFDIFFPCEMAFEPFVFYQTHALPTKLFYYWYLLLKKQNFQFQMVISLKPREPKNIIGVFGNFLNNAILVSTYRKPFTTKRGSKVIID